MCLGSVYCSRADDLLKTWLLTLCWTPGSGLGQSTATRADSAYEALWPPKTSRCRQHHPAVIVTHTTVHGLECGVRQCSKEGLLKFFLRCPCRLATPLPRCRGSSPSSCQMCVTSWKRAEETCCARRVEGLTTVRQCHPHPLLSHVATQLPGILHNVRI